MNDMGDMDYRVQMEYGAWKQRARKRNEAIGWVVVFILIVLVPVLMFLTAGR